MQIVKQVSIYIMVNAIFFFFVISLKFLVSKFYFNPWTRTIAIMKMPLNQWSSTFSTYRLTKSSQKRWRLSVAYLNLPKADFLFLCYLQQLFICSGSANHRLKNTILVTHIAFHLAPLTLQTKMLSTSERTWSQRSHIKHYFVLT